jgi:hypothetical protein
MIIGISIYDRTRLIRAISLRFLVRFCSFDGCERVNQSRMNVQDGEAFSYLSKGENCSEKTLVYTLAEKSFRRTTAINPMDFLYLKRMKQKSSGNCLVSINCVLG